MHRGFTGKPQGCRICGGPISYHQLVYNQICSDWRCKKALLELEMGEYRDMAARVRGIDRPCSYRLIAVPGDPREIQRQPYKRKQAHIDFLFDLCVQTLVFLNGDGDSTSEDRSGNLDPPAKMASDVCGICRGACCHFGNESAFLDRAAILRFIDSSGISDPLQIVYAYYGHLPAAAVADACVYQADQGCTLPRWMRADICNSYRCEGLRQAEKMISRDGIQRFCVLVRRDNRIIRCGFMKNHEIIHYP